MLARARTYALIGIVCIQWMLVSCAHNGPMGNGQDGDPIFDSSQRTPFRFGMPLDECLAHFEPKPVVLVSRNYRADPDYLTSIELFHFQESWSGFLDH
jgi:hypothetical protein